MTVPVYTVTWTARCPHCGHPADWTANLDGTRPVYRIHCDKEDR